MRDFRDAKAMAKALRHTLSEKSITLSHGESLELVARQFGFDNWNVLAAKIAAEPADSGPALSPAIPILRIFSVEKAYEFYLGYLGFTLAWEHRFGDNFPLYAQIARAGLTLHLSEHHGDASPGSKIFVPMTGIEAFHRELSAKDYRYARPGLEDAPWGARTLEVTDPFGNRLLFNEDRATEKPPETTAIRRAGPEDAAAVRTLTRAAFAKWVPLIGREPLPMVADYDVAVRDHLIDLLLRDGRLVGLIETIPAADHLLIENLSVSPDRQGEGHGHRLMAHAEALAASLGLTEMKLYTNKLFDENLRFYRKLGYAVEREAPFRGGTVVHMNKKLAAGKS